MTEPTTAQPRALVTGAGTINPLGASVAETWQALLAGKSGITALTGDWAGQLPVKIAGRVAVEPADVLERVKARRLDVDLTDEEIAERVAAYEPPDNGESGTGVLAKYAKLVSSAAEGAVTR